MSTATATKIRPLNEKVLVQRHEPETQTASGIYLPESAAEKPQKAKVIAIGDGKRLDNGQRAQFQVKPGDTVILSKWGGTEVKVDDEEYLILNEEDILAVESD